MKKIRIVALAMLTVLLAACHEELDLIEKVQEGLPARLDLTISLPSSEKIQTKGIYDYESEISELMLIMYETNGRKMVVDLTGKITAGAADGAYGGHRTYTTTEEITHDKYGTEILSGTYRVYAIANWSSPFCELTQDNILAMSEDELNDAVGTNSGYVHKLTGNQKFPMTGYTEGIVINPYDPDGATTVTGISLRRMIAHMEFTFVNGKDNIKFVPQTYQIFNIPSGAYLMDNRTKTDSGWSNTESNKYNGNYGHSNSIDIVSGGEISFFMQENVQGPAENVSSYTDRDKWEGTEDGTKKFLNAPENSTYVVVTGEYEDGTYTGTISYTIHLGKFGKSSEASGANNFEVSRNEYHTYTITINGRNSIIAEAESDDQTEGGNVPGAEGTLTLTNKGSQFVLDAHYETVMLSFSLSDLCAQPTMIVQTPYSDGLKEYSLTDTDALSVADYKWIHFMRPTSTSALSPYPTTDEQNNGALTDVVGLAAELQAALDAKNNGETPTGDHILIETDTYGNSTVYVQAFVDEYFYETDPSGSKANWTDFVNKDNRTLILNPEKNVSPDGNSIVYPDYIFQISQRSIKTTYGTASSTVNGFGIETWNETGRVEWGTPDNESELNDYNGYANTKTLLGDNWLSDDVVATTGYLTSITNNTKESHVFYSSDDIGLSSVYGYNSCLTRNRDENGNGTIEDTELKWYLPAVFQYTNLWMGLDYLKEDTQLFDPDTEISSSDDFLIYNFYTSSSHSGAKAEYWAIEGASYGNRQHTNAVRCVRNLYDTDGIYDDVNAPITYNDSGNRIISVLSASESALRSTNMTGEYTAGHNERDVNNRLPNAFEVAENNLTIGADGYTNTTTLKLEDLGDVPFGITAATATYSNSWLNANLTFATTEYSYSLKGESPITGNNLTFSHNIAEPWVTLVISNGNADDYIALYFNFDDDGLLYSITIYKMLDNEDYEYNSENNWGKLTDSHATLTFSSENKNTFTKSEIHDNATGFCASYYSQEEDESDLGQWRIPNQRELMLMAEFGYLSDASSSNTYASRTFFSYYDYKTEPFSYNGHITLQSDSGDSFVIRCVRDATPTSPTSLEDATYSNSNNSLF